jgi:hypothetical protein
MGAIKLNPVFMHDQCLAYIQDDALFTALDGALSFEILAKEFEHYWRNKVAKELEEIEPSKDISSDWYAASCRVKMVAIAIARGPNNGNL